MIADRLLAARAALAEEPDERTRADLFLGIASVFSQHGFQVVARAVVDDWDLRRLGRGRVKDAEGRAAAGGRRIVLTGQLRHGEVRVHRGGIAQLSAMFSREYLADLRRAHADGTFPTVDDPARTT
jgi:hypothetical protein